MSPSLRCLLLSSGLLLMGLKPPATNRYALLIGIGTYPPSIGVEALNATNDVRLLRETLLKQGFPNQQILTLANQQATRRAIEHRLDSLAKHLPVGSRLVLHFSGHALQIPDDNRDEPDHLDEAILPYDGRPNQPATLLRDDQLATCLSQLRARVGPTGHVLFLFDSCHSGSIWRQQGKAKQVGRGVGVVPPSDVVVAGTSGWLEQAAQPGRGLGRYALLAAATDGQASFECADANGQPYGPLTLAVCRAWQQQRTLTYATFFEQVRQQMAELAPYQTPVLEGDQHAAFMGQ